MDVNTLSEILGHKSQTVTFNIYAPLLMDHKNGDDERLASMHFKP